MLNFGGVQIQLRCHLKNSGWNFGSLFYRDTFFYTCFGHFLNPNPILPIRSSQFVEGGKNILEVFFFFFQCQLFSKWPGMRHFARLSSIGIHLLHVWMGDLFHCQRLAGPTKTHIFFLNIYGNMSTLEMISSCILSIRLFAEFHAISEIIWTQEFLPQRYGSSIGSPWPASFRFLSAFSHLRSSGEPGVGERTTVICSACSITIGK